MNKLIILATIASLSGIMSCSDNDPVQPVPETAVRLEGAIGLSTRGVIGSDYDTDLDVNFARQDETTGSAGTYGTWGVHKAVREGGGGNRLITFAEPQLYPPDGRRIHLHGYYPAQGESAADAGTGKVIFRIDGATDIMATGLLAGNGFNPVTTCTFRHLLTQIRLACYSDKAGDWGSIKTIEAIDVHARQELDLGEQTPRLVDISSDEDIKNIPVQDITNLTIPEVVANESPPEAQGYLLLPVTPTNGTAEHPLHLRVTTTKDGRGNAVETVSDVLVTIDGGFETGKSHIISLLFTGKGAIQMVNVGVDAWANKEQDEMPI